MSILLPFELNVCATVCDQCAKIQLNPLLSGRIKAQELKMVPCCRSYAAAIAPERRGLGKNPLGDLHISTAPTEPENFSQIGNIACAAVCRFLQAGAIKEYVKRHSITCYIFCLKWN